MARSGRRWTSHLPEGRPEEWGRMPDRECDRKQESVNEKRCRFLKTQMCEPEDDAAMDLLTI
jgi:hypothetical protein